MPRLLSETGGVSSLLNHFFPKPILLLRGYLSSLNKSYTIEKGSPKLWTLARDAGGISNTPGLGLLVTVCLVRRRTGCNQAVKTV